MFWRPRSLLQLMLIGFFTVVAPLCVAIFYTVQAFDRLSLNNSRMTQNLVTLTRTTQVLQSDLFDLERKAGQYQALGEENFLALFEQGYQRVVMLVDELEVLVDQERAFHLLALRETLGHLQVAMQASTDRFDNQAIQGLFDQISTLSLAFRRASQLYVDEQQDQQDHDALEIKQSLLLMVSLLALLTLIAVLFFTYWINRPVRQLEREIGLLGSGDLSRRIRISGPQEMQLLGQRLEWLREQLHELEEQKQQFLRHMSHELKTPLASLREGADLMAEGVVGNLDSRQLEIVSIIQQNSSELQRLIENLLDYNQVLHHRQLKIEEVDIQALWLELLDSYSITIGRKTIRLSCDGKALSWLADPAKLRTVLDNLLSNAISYCPLGGEVKISWRQLDNMLVCDVSNSGQAIADDDAEKIFQPFYQGRNRRDGAIKGSGIGLSVARESVLVHRGTLQLVPSASLPVCFRLQLPLLEVDS
ncbi:MAG: HAMP domain-containing sensor histidine kinase [Halopseudomonas sp.]